MKEEPKTVAEYSARIEQALDQNGPYTHNLIGLHLRSCAKKFGRAEANKLIDLFALDTMGYKKMPV